MTTFGFSKAPRRLRVLCPERAAQLPSIRGYIITDLASLEFGLLRSMEPVAA